MSASLAEDMPDRVIASAPVCLKVGPKTEKGRSVPMLTIFGERDGKQLEKLSAKLPEQRALGAQWAIAIQWEKARVREGEQPDHAILRQRDCTALSEGNESGGRAGDAEAVSAFARNGEVQGSMG